MKLVIASSNKHKLQEMKNIFAPYGVEIIPMTEVSNSNIDIEENGSTYYENALIKCNAIAQYTSLPILADDSGVEVEALNNQPGIYSARFAEAHGGYHSACAYIINECKKVNKYRAKFVCNIVVTNLKKEPLLFEGIVPGEITQKELGDNGFGYDPVFKSDELEKTFAEYPEDIKNKYSHRAKALEKFINYLKVEGYIK